MKKVCDILDGISYNITDNSFDVTVPCGMFRFIDIELQKAIYVNFSVANSIHIFSNFALQSLSHSKQPMNTW